MKENPFKPFGKQSIDERLFDPIISLKPEAPEVYYKGKLDHSLTIEGMEFAQFEFTSSLYGFVLQSISGTLIPCVGYMSERLQEFAELLQKHMNCLIAYITPQYFESMQMSAQLQGIESEIDDLIPIAQRIDDEKLSNETDELNQQISIIKEDVKKVGLSEITNDLFLIDLPPVSDNLTNEDIWNYYEYYKKLQSIREKLEDLQDYANNAYIEDEGLKQNLTNDINNAINKVDELENLIPPELKEWFDKREEVLQATTKEVELLDLALNPDKLKGIPECINLTRDIYCKQQFRQAVCYASFLGTYIQEMLGSATASSRDNFIQDFARRLGGKQAVDVDDMFATFQEMAKSICGESIDDLNSMFNNMKEMVHEVSTSMYEVQTKTCNGRKGRITEDTISLFDKAICKDGKIIVPIQEKIGLIVCDTGGNPYGIEITVSGDLDGVTAKSDEFNKKSKKLYVSGSISPSAKTNSPNKFLIGEAPQGSGSTGTIYLKAYLECDLGSQSPEQAIQNCVAKYRADVQWKLITFQKDSTEREITYVQNGDLGDACESIDTIRRFDDNSKKKYDRNSCGTSSSTSGSSQTSNELIVRIDCSDPNNPKQLDHLDKVNLPPALIKGVCSCDKNRDGNIIVKVNTDTQRTTCME